MPLNRIAAAVVTALIGLVLVPEPLAAAGRLPRGMMLYASFDSFSEGELVWAANPDGSSRRVLANGLQPALSPDRTRIVFAEYDDWDVSENIDLYSSAVGSERRTRLARWGMYPTWSPDGSKIAYVALRNADASTPGEYEGPEHSEIFVMKPDGSGKRNLTRAPVGFEYLSSGYAVALRAGYLEPAWSPNGKKIAYSRPVDGAQAIFVMRADGTHKRRLTEPGFYHPSWSPDGSKLEFASHPKGRHSDGEIFVMNADGTRKRRITDNDVDEVTPTWGPDGRTIYYSSETNSEAYQQGIYVLRLGDKGRRGLTCDRDHETFEPVLPGGGWDAAAAGPRRSPTRASAGYKDSRQGLLLSVSIRTPEGPCDSPGETCIAGRWVVVSKRRENGDKVVVARFRSDHDGIRSIDVGRGDFFAEVKPKEFTSPEGRRVTCLYARANKVPFPPP